MPVHAGEEEGAQAIEIAAHLFGEGDDGARRMTHIGGAPGLKRRKPPLALGDGVFDHRADQAANGLIEEPCAVDTGIGLPHLGERARRDRHFGKLGEGEEAGAIAVIDVVIVIGDVVGESGGLGLDRGEGRKFEVLPGAIVEDRLRHLALRPLAWRIGPGQRTVMLDQAFERLPGEIEAVEARIFLFERGDHAERLGIVVEAAGIRHRGVERALAGMAEGRMAEIVGERQGLGEILVDAQASGRARGRSAPLRGCG